MDTETVTVKEIAKAVEIAQQNVLKRANKENWPHEVLNKRGDRRFPLATLPEKIQEALALRQAQGASEQIKKQPRSSILIIAIKFKLWELDLEWTLKL
jgi:hypothetical protein